MAAPGWKSALIHADARKLAEAEATDKKVSVNGMSPSVVRVVFDLCQGLGSSRAAELNFTKITLSTWPDPPPEQHLAAFIQVWRKISADVGAQIDAEKPSVLVKLAKAHRWFPLADIAPEAALIRSPHLVPIPEVFMGR